MRKNIAGQKVAGQQNSKFDGSPITTGVSVFCTQDNSSQAAGLGSSVHKGNGEWIYLPTQAETNGNHVTFTFVSANSVAQTIQIYTIGYDPQNPASSGGGTGAFLITVTVIDQLSVPLQNAIVQITDGIMSATLATGPTGQATFSLNAGTYWASVTKGGYQFTPVQRTVTSNQSGSLIDPLVMEQVVIPAPAVGFCRVFGSVFFTNGQPAANITATFTLFHPDPIKHAKLIARRPLDVTTDSQGRITDGTNLYQDLLRNDFMTPSGSKYHVDSGALGFQEFEVELITETLDLASVIT